MSTAIGQRAAVWAPQVEHVELQVGSDRVLMPRGSGGWWESPSPLSPGTDYGYLVNGEGPFPDPRSRWQPQGVCGLSRAVDFNAFNWTDTDWTPPPMSRAVFYELHIGTFTEAGTFAAAMERLSYLHDLGVTHVEVMPVAAFHGQYGWGYDGVSLYAPHEPYGGPAGFQQFVDQCHAHGLAVVLDVVYNHLGPVGNFLSRFGPYFHNCYVTPWGPSVNLDGPDSDEVRRFFIDNALMWLRDYHCDGLRLDAVHAFIDLSAYHFLEQLTDEVDALSASLGKKFVLIAESDLNDPKVLRPREQGGYGVDAQWSDDVHHAVHAWLTGEQRGYYVDYGAIDQVAHVLHSPFYHDGRHSPYRRRRHGRSPAGLSPHRFVVCLQNHDQIGNRAGGERITLLASQARVQAGAALILLSPYVPMLFQGEEWGASTPFPYFVDFHDDPVLSQAVSEGRKNEFAAFGWPLEEILEATDVQTFAKAKLKWQEMETAEHGALREWYRSLLRLRRDILVCDPDGLNFTAVQFDAAEQWLSATSQSVTIAINLGTGSRDLPVDRSTIVTLASTPLIQREGAVVRMPPESVVVLRHMTG